ncbi:tetratricopeptide repeat protein [Leptolyngbya sp. AN03gr2]|uniref:tetratricopeptide repeat protein n=1 Tax=unclassified Leptolyngbya TaxID=2650499 RepID=UPI003D314973
MFQRFTIGLLSLVPFFAVPAVAQTACQSFYPSSLSDRFVSLPMSPEFEQQIRAIWQAEIAIEFLRANRSDRLEQINETIRSQMKLSPESATALRLLQNLAVGKTNDAIALVPGVQSSWLNSSSVSLQLLELPLKDRTQWVLKVLETMPESSTYFELEKTDWLLNLSAQHQEANSPKQALELLEKARLRTGKTRIVTLIRLAEAYRKSGKLDIARSILDTVPARIETEARSLAIPNSAKVFNLVNLGHQLALLGQSQEALSYLTQAETLLRKSPDVIYQPPVQLLALGYAAAGRSTKAFEVVKLLQPNQADLAYALVAKQAAELGDDRLTIQAIQRIRPESTKAWSFDKQPLTVLPEIIEFYAKAGKFDLAQQVTASIQSPLFQLKSLATIVNYVDRANQASLSDRIVAQMLQIAPKSRSGVPEFEVANHLIQAGAVNRVRQLLNQVSPKDLKSQFAIAYLYTQVGDFQTANQRLDAINVDRAAADLVAFPTPNQYESHVELTPLLPMSGLGSFFSSARFAPLPSVIPAPQQKQLDKPVPIPSAKPSPATVTANRLEILGALAKHYAIAQNFQKANALIEQIPNRYCTFKSDVLAQVTKSAIAANQLEIALNALQKSDRLNQRASQPDPNFVRMQLIAIAKRYSQRNQFKEAALLLESALTLIP